MDRILKSRYFHIGVALVLAAGVLIAYSNTFNSSFHFDDIPHIVSNYAIHDLSNIPSLLVRQRGVTMATFAVNYAIGGLDVTGYHVVNTLIHIASGILAYAFLLLTLRGISNDEPWSRKIAAYAALLFAFHPIQTQCVTYIVQRMESLASLFYLASLLVLVKAAGASTLVKRIILYSGVVAAYVLGFYSKEIAITLPFMALLYDFYFLGGRDGSAAIKVFTPRAPLYGVLFLLLIYFTVSTVVPLDGFGDLSKESAGEVVGAVSAAPAVVEAPTAGFGVVGISPREYLYTQFNVLVYYIALLIVPVNQNLDYDFPVSRGLFETPQVHEGTVLNYPIPPPVVSLVILLVILGAGVYLFLRSRRGGAEGGGKRSAAASFFIFWFFILLAPTSSFVPIVDVIFEHRVYLASLGFFVIFALCVDWFFERIGRAARPGGT